MYEVISQHERHSLPFHSKLALKIAKEVPKVNVYQLKLHKKISAIVTLFSATFLPMTRDKRVQTNKQMHPDTVGTFPQLTF